MMLSCLILALLLAAVSVSVSAGTNEEGWAWLADNKNQPGVLELESGLQYKVLKKGRGPAHPTVDSPCSCHYEGKLLDGTVFDSSYERGEPTTFAPNQVIKGWTEAMQVSIRWLGRSPLSLHRSRLSLTIAIRFYSISLID
jgi:hypothetical protein